MLQSNSTSYKVPSSNVTAAEHRNTPFILSFVARPIKYIQTWKGNPIPISFGFRFPIFKNANTIQSIHFELWRLRDQNSRLQPKPDVTNAETRWWHFICTGSYPTRKWSRARFRQQLTGYLIWDRIQSNYLLQRIESNAFKRKTRQSGQGYKRAAV